jgi:hypothetical protein
MDLDSISRELLDIESASLAIEAGRTASSGSCKVRSLSGLFEALPLARQWRALGIASNLDVISEVARALKQGGAGNDPVTQDLYRFVRAVDGDPRGLLLEAFWLELRKGLTEWGVADDACANALVGATREMHDNVLQHSGRPASGYCGFRIGKTELEVGVVDSGLGLTAAFLETNPGDSVDPMTLLESAVLHGKSRLKDGGRGTGFATLLRALRRLDAKVRVRSDDVSLTLTPTGGTEYEAELKQESKLCGFVVCARLRRAS